MAAWRDVVAAEPELAERVQQLFDARAHKTIATLRRDGSPRISGIECRFADGDLWFGSMPNAVKALDLRRDPRFALHGGSADPPEWSGDAKVAGRAEEVTDPERRRAILEAMGSPSTESHLFRADLTEVVVTRLGEPRDHLVIESWHEGRGAQRRERR
jgi:hypothetical protein